MRRIIHNLRNKPEHIRMHILNVFTLCAAVVLVMLWVYSLGTNLSDPDTQANLKNDLQPFSVLKDNLVGGYHSLTAGVENVEQ